MIFGLLILFPTECATTWRLGNHLKRVLKPLAGSVGIEDLTFQCLRRACATHFGGDVKARQTHMRHAEPATTLRHYQKAIPGSQRLAVEESDAEFRVSQRRPTRPERSNETDHRKPNNESADGYFLARKWRGRWASVELAKAKLSNLESN